MWQTWNSVCWFVVCLWGQAQHKHTSLRLAVAANLPISSRRHAKPRCGFASRPDVKFSFCVTASQSQNGLYSCHNRRISDLSKPKCFKWIPAWRCTVCGDCSVLFCWICGQKILFFWRFSSLFSGFTASQQVTDGWQVVVGRLQKKRCWDPSAGLQNAQTRLETATLHIHILSLCILPIEGYCVSLRASSVLSVARASIGTKGNWPCFLCLPFIGHTRVFFSFWGKTWQTQRVCSIPHTRYFWLPVTHLPLVLLARQRSYSSPCTRAKGHKSASVCLCRVFLFGDWIEEK